MNYIFNKTLLLLMLSTLLWSCADMAMHLPKILPDPVQKTTFNTAQKVVTQAKPISASRMKKLPALSVATWRESVTHHATIDLPKGELELSAEAMPLKDFIHMALGDVLGLSFEVDQAVASRSDAVTLHISHPVKAQRLLAMVEQALDLYGVGLAWDDGNLRVLPKSKLSKRLPAVVSGAAGFTLKKGRVIMMIPFRYASPGEALGFARYFLQMGQGAEVSMLPRLNALIVIGMADRVRSFKQAVEMIDKPGMTGRTVSIVRPVYWKVDELLKPIATGLRSMGVPVAKKIGDPGLFFIPIKSMNAIVVVSSQKKWRQQFESWVNTLDTIDAVGEGKQVFVYFVRQNDAKSLGKVLSSVFGSTIKAADGKSKSKNKPVAPVSKGVLRAGGSDQLKVVVDEQHNALIFVGTASAYSAAHQLLERLDVPAKQVLLEATIADITLDESHQLGIEWQFTNVDRSNMVSGVLSTLGGLGVGAAGLSYSLINNAGSIRARLNALASSGRAKILSSPRLLAKDNEEARIQVGTQVPVVSQEVGNATATTGTSTSLLRSFSYVDTGVILTFTPTVTENGAVQLKISQEVSEAGASASNTPPISTRNIKTTLVAQSGQSIMIGGLITHNQAEQVVKVPFLGDLPVIGHLFSKTSITDRSTEMIILITPHVIRSSSDADFLTRAFQQQLDWK